MAQSFPSGAGEPAPPRGRTLPASEDDTDELRVAQKRGGVSGRLVLICLVLLALGLAAFALVEYAPLLDEVESLRAEVATLSGAAERADDAEAALAALREEKDALERELSALRGEHSSLAAEADALRAEREAAEAALAELREQMQSEIAAGDVSVRSEGGNLGVGLASRVLFRSGSADLSPRGEAILRRVAESLRRVESRVIQVAGHTDSNPISETLQDRYPTNWELSTARATNVVRFLQEQCEVPGSRLVAAGLAEYRPAANNDTARGRLHNRRIDLALLPLPPVANAD